MFLWNETKRIRQTKTIMKCITRHTGSMVSGHINRVVYRGDVKDLITTYGPKCLTLFWL